MPAHHWLVSIPRVFDSVNLEWGLRIYISNKFSGDADSVGPGTALGEELRKTFQRA